MLVVCPKEGDLAFSPRPAMKDIVVTVLLVKDRIISIILTLLRELPESLSGSSRFEAAFRHVTLNSSCRYVGVRLPVWSALQTHLYIDYGFYDSSIVLQVNHATHSPLIERGYSLVFNHLFKRVPLLTATKRFKVQKG